jgi:hypothetical protein
MYPGRHIRIGYYSEQRKIQEFLRVFWKSDHALVMSDSLMSWQHGDRLRNRCNFVLACNAQDEIDALLGFIPVSQFDPALAYLNEYWLAIWKLSDQVKAPGLGMTLMNWFIREMNPRTIGCIGISPEVLPAYKLLKFELGKLSQLYILHPSKKDFALVSGAIPKVSARSRPSNARSEVKAITEADFLRIDEKWFSSTEFSPRKSKTFFVNRYLRHPIYSYRLFGIYGRSGSHDATLQNVAVSRIASARGGEALRIVDLIGPLKGLEDSAASWQDLLSYLNLEYLDLFCHGEDTLPLINGGFSISEDQNPVIIPNYFEPFVPDRRPINYAIRVAGKEPYRFFKADSDQDRPSII